MADSTAYEKYPKHTLVFDPKFASARISVGDLVLTETARALVLREGRYPEVLYIPREDIQMERLRAGKQTTHCPFKGDATYFDFVGGESEIAEIAWSYEDPFDQMNALRGHLAFYSDRADITRPNS